MVVLQKSAKNVRAKRTKRRRAQRRSKKIKRGGASLVNSVHENQREHIKAKFYNSGCADSDELYKIYKQTHDQFVNTLDALKKRDNVIQEKDKVIRENEGMIQEKDKVIREQAETNKDLKDQITTYISGYESSVAEQNEKIGQTVDYINMVDRKIKKLESFTSQIEDLKSDSSNIPQIIKIFSIPNPTEHFRL